MTRPILQLIALAWALLFCVVARADTARILDHLCQRPDLASIIDRAATKHHVSALRLAVLMKSENTRCREDAVNITTHAAGLFGILPTGSANPAHLAPAKLLDADTSTDLGAAHLARLLQICGTFAGALHLYHSKDGKCQNWRSDSHVKRVLGMERALLRWLHGPKHAGRVG